MRHNQSFPIHPKLVTQCLEGMDQSLQALDDGKPAVTKKSRKGVSKPPKKGGMQMMRKLVALCEKHGVTQIGKLTLHDLELQLQQTDSMEKIFMRARDLFTKADDSRFEAETTAWNMALPLYVVLQRLALSDQAIMNDLEGDRVITFFAKPRSKKSAAVAVPGATAPAPVAGAAGTIHATVAVSAPVTAASVTSNGVTNGVSNGVAKGVSNGQSNGASPSAAYGQGGG